MKKIFNIFIASLLMLAFGLANTACVDEVQDPSQKYAAPTITGFSPAEGLPSSIVTITGTEFGKERTERIGRVYFGGVEATEYVSWSDTEIQVRVPENGKSGAITLWVWKNNVTTEAEFTCIPGAKVNSIDPSEAYPSSEITVVGENFGYFMDLPLSEILVEFKTTEGTEKVAATSLTETELTVTVPATAQSGAMTVYFGDMQTITTPELTLVGDYVFDYADYLEMGGTIKVEEGGLGSTKNGGWIIYEFTAPATGYFEAIVNTATTKDGSSLNVNISSDLNKLKNQEVDEAYTQVMPNSGSWTQGEQLTYGVWYMEVGKTYYMKLTFLQEGSTWVGNVNMIKIALAADQTAASGEIQIPFIPYTESGGSIVIEEGGIGSTKNGGWVIYEISTPRSGLYDVVVATATKKDGSKLNIDVNSDLTTIKTQSANDALTQDMPNSGSWSEGETLTYGPFRLEAGKTYYMKMTFLTSSTSWVGNINDIKVLYSDNQNSGPVTDSEGVSKGYVIYENDFNTGDTYSPFRDGWAWDPCYIKVQNQYCEFYYNQAAYDEDPRRMRAGCELTCDYKTTTAGWYGFKIFLPEGKFSKDINGSIIAQLFQQGTANTWAGHLDIDKDKLTIDFRADSGTENVKTGVVGTLEWEKWTPVVVYFKVGKNKKGNIKVWMGDDMKENTPTYDSGAVNFGFGDWIDDDTLNGESKGGEDVADAIGAKFGLYVSSGGDRTIRFDDVKLLEGNPSGAFDIVKPN